MTAKPRIDGDRVERRRQQLGLSQATLAKKCEVSQAAIAKLIAGETQSFKHIHLLARALLTTPDFLLGGTDDPDIDAVPVPTMAGMADQLGLASVQEVDLALGMGGTFLDVAYVQESYVHFPREWLRRFTPTDPSQLVFTRGDGDSMSPTINDGDIVLIDRSQLAINRQDRIWAVAYGEIGMIKRVRAMPDGSYSLMSDNAAVDPATAVDGEMHVIGRVVAAIRGM